MKTAIVTGSIKGVGKSVGIELLKKGCFVIFNYANDDTEAERLDNKLKLSPAYKDMYKIIKADLSNINAVNEFAERCIAVIGKVDYLILNAGYTDRSNINEITVENWEKVMNVNLTMPFFIVKSFNEYINDNRGRIIFIGIIMVC